MPQIRRSVLAASASLLIAAVLVVVAPSAAQAASGAIRSDFHYCSDDGTFCSDGTTLTNTVTTATGNSVVTYHSQYINTLSGFGCSGQTQEQETINYLLKPDVTGVYHFRVSGQSTLQCEDGTSTTCEYSYLFTLADDEVRLDKVTTDCTEA
jgi:hypothetical protein